MTEETKRQGKSEFTSSDEELDDIVRGMMFASLSITDDKELTLQKVGKSSPWHIEALKIITGNEEQANRPLTEILKEHMDLELDCHIDIRGITKGGQFLDTQGYIAHNDKKIVLAYRCTTSFFDWITNFNTSTSEWEVEEDLAQGFSGYCSCLEGLTICCGTRKPRVHTGFYNNFLASLPLIREHLEPLLGADQPARKLYVTGHSLGAGVATLATCYFLEEFDWLKLPHSFCSVTAGSPRACGVAMQEVMEERIRELGSSVSVYRLVKGRDVVATVPPAALGFRHIGETVLIDKDGKITLPTSSQSEHNEEKELKELVSSMPAAPQDEEGQEKSKYEKFVSRIPEPLRDHMPDFYLKPLFHCKGIKCGSVKGEQS